MFFSLSAISQEVVVRDAENKTALSKAEISSATEIVIYTDRRGIFELDTFINESTIFISHNGYTTKAVYVKEISTEDPTIYLDREAFDLGQATVTPKGESITKETTQQVAVLESKEIQFGNPMTSASMLENSGLLSVQRSQLGGGSPVMRGFEANKVLLLVDGVRMNNAIYRSGHLQNAITIDPLILEKTEVYFGPASVLYGSDALGGAVHFKTKRPVLAEDFNKDLTRVNIIGRLASASQENILHFDVMHGKKKFGFLTSFTRSDFGNLRMGTNRKHGYSDWGLVPYFSSQEEGIDMMRSNANPNVQKSTGYTQFDLLQKFTYKLSSTSFLNANFQYSTSTDVPRFDQLSEVTDGKIRWAEWYYGPQTRLLGSLNLNIINRKHFTDANFTLAYQKVDEDRIKRRFGRSEKFINEEDVNVFSLNADLIWDRNEDWILFYGAEITHNSVASAAWQENIITGDISEAITRYPNGGSEYTTAGAYVNGQKNINPKLEINIGLRYNHTLANSEIIENEFFELPYSRILINDNALTSSITAVYTKSENFKLYGGVSSGFKSPNVDDYGKVFERDGFAVIPNDQLKSEYIYSVDFTAEKQLLQNKLRISATPYFTYLTNAIVRRDTILNGSNTLDIEGETALLQTNTNAAEAIIYGLSSQLRYLISENLLFSATYNYTYGQDISSAIPLAHIPPQFGKINLQYQKDRYTLEAYINYASAKTLDRYAPGTTDNLAEATESGTPAWQTLNLRTSTRLSKTVILQAAVENITDRHFKTFASGLSAPGRNFIFSLKTFF